MKKTQNHHETLHNIAYLVKYKGSINNTEHSRKIMQAIVVSGSKW